MFGRWKKRPRLGEAQRQFAKLVWDAAELVIGQHLARLGSKPQAAAVLMKNKAACGYVFGFHDGLLQGFRADWPDDEWEAAVVRASYEHLFGVEGSGRAVFDESIDLQSDPQFSAGQQLGGSEALRFRQEGIVPRGLFMLMGAAR